MRLQIAGKSADEREKWEDDREEVCRVRVGVVEVFLRGHAS
jgi:hypothetical protein